MKAWLLIPLLLVACGDTGDDANSATHATNNVNLDMSDGGVDINTDSEADIGTPELDPGEFNTPDEALDWVDPFIGTGGLGFAYGGLTPSAQVPNGMVKVGPDTTLNGSHPQLTYHFSGYYFNDPHIRGFSHLRLVGTGTTDYGNLRILPNTPENLIDRVPGAWWQTSDKSREAAEPGYYAAFLEESETLAEMVPTLHGAIHRYTWEGDKAQLLTIDPASTIDDKGILGANITRQDNVITGSLEYKGGWSGRSRGFTLYYVMELSQTPDTSDTWIDDVYTADSNQAEGLQTGMVLKFSGLTEPLIVRVAVSLIDDTQAQETFNTEVANTTFDEVREAAKNLWLEKLERVRIAGGKVQDKAVFFTALYNTYRMPTRFDEYGRYRGLDGAVHDVDHPYYTDLSLWDTYRTLHPWYTLYDPEVQRDVLNSLLLMAQDGGYVPAWPAALSYTGGMVGTPADVLFGEAAIKGIDGVNYAEAFGALVASHDTPDGAPFRGRFLPEEYLQFGYLPADLGGESAARTLEYAVHDSGMAALATFLNRPDVELYRNRAKYYQNIWDKDSGFLRPKNADGSWEEPFVPTQFSARSGGPYTEGTAWHWTLHAPHDPAGLRETMGDAPLLQTLETLFAESKQFRGNKALWALPDTKYWHGNQPPLHDVFYFAELGRLDLLGQWTRKIQRLLYDDTPDGLIGNDDGGTLSAWLLFSAVGFYPMVTTDTYFPSPPLFGRIQIDLPNGNTIDVSTNNWLASSITSIAVNGNRLDGTIRHADLTAGADISYTLTTSE